MTTYYVGAGGDNANSGLSWALRKLTLNGAEDIPVAAGDTVYVGPGTYRETLTCDVSGSAGSPITYIGDYSGAHTDGVGGVVRITGSDNDQAAARANCITASAKNNRTFRGLLLDTTSGALVAGTNCTDWTLDQLYLGQSSSELVDCNGASQARWSISRSYFSAGPGISVYFNHSSTVDNAGHAVENCIFPAGYIAVYFLRVGGATVRNSIINRMEFDGILTNGLTVGQNVTVNNSIITNCGRTGLLAVTAGEIIENYNTLYGNSTARTNVATGANSTAYPPLFDTRWFFEAVAGGDMVTPFDLASYSQLVNVAGTSSPITDMRGTSVIGAQREWGPLEYNPALLIEAGSGGGAVSISPYRGNL